MDEKLSDGSPQLPLVVPSRIYSKKTEKVILFNSKIQNEE